jgi:uncharacterized membrane protein (UPF0127 family)
MDMTQRYHAVSIGVAIGLGMMMMGCSASTPVASQDPPTPARAQPVAQAGQSLPISAQFQVGRQVVQLEVAKTPDEQAMGLMYRSQLAPDRGMIFSFSPARQVGFWMKNVLINLDMVFLHKGKVVAIASNVPPCTTEPCPVYGPGEVVDQVIELKGGRAQELGIKPGDRLVVQPVGK